ncbi:MAG: D-alanyl-D-alanine carboxypeptidase/D-alanyl-D-alanine-endopeptidase [Planctomycetota bacterium]
MKRVGWDMKCWKLALLCVLLYASTAVAGLQQDIDAAVRRSGLGSGNVGVSVVKLDDKPRVVAGHNADSPMLPASNMKLVTTAATLHYLGPDFRFRTLLVEREVNGRREVGVIGDGDPTIGDSELLAQFGWTTTTTLDQWARILEPGGDIGALLVDDSVFDQEYMHPRWGQRDQVRPYGAQVGGLNLNANCVDFYVQPRGNGQRVGYRLSPPTGYASITNRCVKGSKNAVILDRILGTNRITLAGQTNARREQGPLRITIDNPTAFFGVVLRERIEAAGIAVDGTPMQDRALREDLINGIGGWRHIGGLETKLSVVLARVNKSSENLYAEALVKRIGHHVTGESGSWDNGNAAIASYLAALGFQDGEDFVLSDGSGLSRGNRVTPRLLTACIADAFGRFGTTFVNSLAVAGKDGTISRRFGRHPDMVGKVFAKSGYISGVYTLSGVVHTDAGWYAFSILVNNARGGAAPKTLHETIVAAIESNAR